MTKSTLGAPTALQTIEASCLKRLSERRGRVPLEDLKNELQSSVAGKKPFGKDRIRENIFEHTLSSDRPHIIAEVKFSSPSQGVLRSSHDPVEVAAQYLAGGASALSVLTEQDHFGGSYENLISIHERFPTAPLLMKDFIIDEYQIYEAAVIGADAVLLIVALLNDETLERFYRLAQTLGLSSLVEVHNEDEMKRALKLGARIIGVNNRDLKTLKVSFETSKRLSALAPRNTILVCESGIESSQQIIEMRELGFKGFLVGTSLMKASSPGQALAQLIKGLL